RKALGRRAGRDLRAPQRAERGAEARARPREGHGGGERDPGRRSAPPQTRELPPLRVPHRGLALARVLRVPADRGAPPFSFPVAPLSSTDPTGRAHAGLDEEAAFRCTLGEEPRSVPGMSLEVHAYGVTDIGRKRKLNEDALLL